MTDLYSNYNEKHIRNKENPAKDEEMLADLLAEEEVSRFIKKFESEPRFLGRIAPKLARRLIDHLPDAQ